MKIKLLVTFVLFFCFQQNSQAQFWKKLKEKVVEKVEEKITEKTVEKTEEEIDDILNKKKKDKKTSEKKTPNEQPNTEESSSEKTENTNEANNTKDKSIEVFRNFKFIPGEKVIFYDDLEYEEIGEFPSRWDLVQGGAEIASFNSEKVIIGTASYNNSITPLFKNENYLGDEFTIEFDVYIDDISRTNDWVDLDISFKTNKEDSADTNERNDLHLSFRTRKLSGYVSDNGSFNLEEVTIEKLKDWNHIAISYYKGKLKIYFNEHRVSNLPNFKKEIIDLGIIMNKPNSDGDNPNQDMKVAIKNIRIAHGGGQMYKRIMADGKYVTNGILFDSGKATIKPQSMGIINKMVNVMKEKADWNFEIIGHTDSDGDDASNLTLSKQRAEAVKQAIVDKGIAADRLSTTGKGETEPLNTNSTKEEKANNRRVEFIKK